MTDRIAQLSPRLAAHHQAHLLPHLEALDDAGRRTLLGQLDQINFTQLDELLETHVRHHQPPALPADLAPAPYYPVPGGTPDIGYDHDEYHRLGEERIRAGALAAFTVAGGQGTRLGWNGPKGTYPASVVMGKPLFRCFAEQILASEQKYRVTIPWYIMTSPLNDDATRSFFSDNNCFGLDRRNIFMFPQGVMPSLEMETGRLLLAGPGRLALNPDGHGGALVAMRQSGAMEDMIARGVEQVSYFQVDNPLVKVIDPLFVGLHCSAPDSSSEMSSKMVAKTHPEERVGVFATSGGKTMVVEYSDLPDALAQERNDAGLLRFNAGSIAIHLISVPFIGRLTDDPDHSAIPFHRAVKKVPYLDLSTGHTVEPAAPNAVKLETFIFDALPLAESSIVLETDRTEEFAPIKNASGADSPQTSHQLQSNRNAHWLQLQNVTVPVDAEGNAEARIEISPLTALCPADLSGVSLPEQVERGAELVL